MNRKNININEVVLSDYFKNSNSKLMHTYVITTYLTAGYGYISIPDYIQKVTEFTSLSKKTVQRWITKLFKNKLIHIKKGVIYISGRKKLEVNHNTSQIYIKFYEEDLKSYSNFRDHVIRQVAYLLQRRFKYAWKHLSAQDAASLVNTGKIETDFAALRSRKQAGCSISKVQQKLNVDKMTISRSLKGYTEKQWNMTKYIDGSVARLKYGAYFDAIAGNGYNRIIEGSGGKPIRSTYRPIDYRWSFDYLSKLDKYRLKYSIASLIKVDSQICRKR